MKKSPQPVIKDQYTTAQVYFGSMMGLILIESLLVLPPYLMAFMRKGYVKNHPARHNKLVVLCHKLATLPSPIPFLTAHGYPTYLRFIVFAGLNILFGYNRVKFTTDYKLYGWLTLANGGMTFVLSPRGCNLLSLLLRVPTPILLTYHRWCGFACMVHATLHFALTAAHNARSGQLATVFSNNIYQAGVVAWAALALVYLTSLRPIRRRFFELFYYPHYFFLVFAAGAMYHAIHGKEFFLPGLGLWFVDRVWRLRHWFKRVDVASVEHFDGGVTKISVRGVKPRAAGQIAWVQFPSISNIVWHPFTIASAPGGEGATFAIRGLGGFTKEVQRLAGSGDDEKTRAPTPGIAMKMDGPHGVGGTRWGQHPVTVLVAGGIGITPGISIASHIVGTTVSPSSPYSSGSGTRHIHLLWIVKDLSHANWFAGELSNLASLAASTNGKVTLDVTIHYTSSSSGATGRGAASAAVEYSSAYPNPSHPSSADDRTDRTAEEEALVGASKGYQGPGTPIQGRPDILAWFEKVRDMRSGMDVAVSLCGPRLMIDASRKAAAKVSWEGGLFEVEEEVFEF